MNFFDFVSIIKRKTRRFSRNPKEIDADIRLILKHFKIQNPLGDPVIFAGRNWTECPDKPIIFLWKINLWKQDFLLPYLADYRVAYVRNNQSPNSLMKYDSKLFEGDFSMGVWGARPAKALVEFSKEHNVDLFQIEDGFLRSMGVGVKHTRPHSLVFDKTGIYFDYDSKSQLQEMFDSVDLDLDKKLAKEAVAGLNIMRAARLSKYYAYFRDDPFRFEEEIEEERILVLGQVENDASIRFGRDGSKKSGLNKFTNWNLLKTAAMHFRDNRLVYKPHPDIGDQKARSFVRSMQPRTLELVPAHAPVAEVMDHCDAILTQTSLTGFEAALRGKHTVVRGRPFYAGRGLTEDLADASSSRRQMTPEQMFAAAYLQYPRYVHPESDSRCTFFEVASHFIVEQVKHLDLRYVPEHWIDVDLLRAHESFLTAPARLFLYLNQATEFGSASPEEVLKIAGKNPQLTDFSQFSELLINSCNYDALQAYTNQIIAAIHDNWSTMKHDRRLCDSVFEAMCYVQSNLNGRQIEEFPIVGEDLKNKLILDPAWVDVIRKYARILSNGLQYGGLSELLGQLDGEESASIGLYKSFCATLLSYPTRSERGHDRRRVLLLKSNKAYLEALTRRYSSRYDMFLNTALAAMARDDVAAAMGGYNLFLQLFKANEFSFSNPHFESWGMLSKRVGHFFQLLDFFVKHGHYEFAETMLHENFYTDERLEATQRSAMEKAWIGIHAAQANHVSVVNCYSNADPKTQANIGALNRYSKSLRALGEFDQSRSILQHRLSTVVLPAKRKALKQEIDKINFCIETSEFLNSYPQPRLPKGIIFLASQTCYNTLAMMSPALHALKKKGYAVINLMEGMVSDQGTGLDYIDKFAGTIPTTLLHKKHFHSWEIDWEERKVSALGINFYQGFYEGLSNTERKYTVDLKEDHIYRRFRTQLYRSDTCLEICNNIYNEVVRRGFDVAFVTGNSHVTPFSIFRDFARAKDDPRLSFINCNVAYENYFSNLGSKFASTMCVTDMTLHRDRRAPFFALRHKFDSWYADNKNDKKLKEQANALITANRNSSADNKSTEKIISWLSAERVDGKKIVCLFGKVPIDLNVPYDGGAAHKDMKDWLNHTVGAARSTPDLIYLIKPHPHELKPQIALDLIDGFADLIEVDIPDNVHIMGHRDINVHALAPHLDLAILWNGSSGLELTALGIPVMMAAWFGQHDYPVDLIYPTSREQYVDYLMGGKFKIPSKELRNRAAFLISYLGSSDVSIPNEYSLRQITNDRVGIPRWRHDALQTYLENGDPNMDLIADRMVEKFTGISR